MDAGDRKPATNKTTNTKIMEATRQQKVERLIQKDLSDIFL